MYHIKRLVQKIMIIVIFAKKVFDKIQHLFIIFKNS